MQIDLKSKEERSKYGIWNILTYLKQEALNQARNEIDAHKQKEIELEQQIQKKEKQIDNLVNSRNMMQSTLAEQIFSLKQRNRC